MWLPGLSKKERPWRLLKALGRDIKRLADGLEELVKLRRYELGLTVPSEDDSDEGTDVSYSSDEETYEQQQIDGERARQSGKQSLSESPWSL